MPAERAQAFSLHGVIVELRSRRAEMVRAATEGWMSFWPRPDGHARPQITVYFHPPGEEQAPTIPDHLPLDRDWPGAECAADDRYLWLRRIDTGTICRANLEQSLIEAWISEQDLAHFGTLAPGLLAFLLAVLLRNFGLFSSHAAGVSGDGRGVLIPAPGGAGKTTIALSLLLSGYQLLSDDLCLLRQRGERIEALRWPRDLGVCPETVDLLPALRPLVASKRPAEDKYQLSPEAIRSPAYADSAPLELLLFPTPAQGPTRLEPMERFEALQRLIPCSLLSAHRASLGEHLTLLRRLVEQCRCYQLWSGTDVAELAELVTPLLA